MGVEVTKTPDTTGAAKVAEPVIEKNPLEDVRGPAVQPMADSSQLEECVTPQLLEELKQLLLDGNVAAFNSKRPDVGLDFSGIDLSNRDLSGVNLSRCNLTRANVSGCNLEQATFSSAILHRADLSRSYLNEANFAHVKAHYLNLSDVRRADDANFEAAQLSRCDMVKGNFQRAKFNHAVLNHSTASDADFTMAEMQQVIMTGAQLDRTTFLKADLYKAVLFQTIGIDVCFDEAHMVGVNALRAVYRSTPPKKEEDKASVAQANAEQEEADKGPRTTFRGAWVRDMQHDGFGTKTDLISDAVKDTYPAEGSYPAKPKPEEIAVLIDGIPGTNLELYQQTLKKLDALIGLTQVKQLVREITEFVRFNHARQFKGLPAVDMAVHLSFTGSPGTGKTTVARLIGQLLFASGYLKKGHTIEVARKDIVAEYAGQTATTTGRKIDEALDGVFYLDEAYSLAQDKQDAYGKEAITTILKEMEDKRGRLVCIFAGYAVEMKDFLDSNSGFRSRINFHINFPDYTNGELVDIMKLKFDEAGFKYSSNVLASGSVLCELLKQREGIRFGNGRNVRSAVEQSVLHMALRVSGKYNQPGAMTDLSMNDLPIKEMVGIDVKDVPWEELRWEQKDEDGQVHTLGYQALPTQGAFPELTADSILLLKEGFHMGEPSAEEEKLGEEVMREFAKKYVDDVKDQIPVDGSTVH